METIQSSDSLIANNKKPVEKRSSGTFALCVSVLALIIVLLNTLISWFDNKTTYQNLKNTASVMGVLEQQTLKNSIDIKNNRKINAEIYVALQQQKEILAQVQQNNNPDQKNTVVNEAGYLMQLAYYNLQFTKDVSAAMVLLQAADQKLASLNAVSLTNVRQLLAKDIAELQAIPKVDMTGILARLNALQLQINQMPVLMPTAKFPEEKNNTADENLPAWRKALHHSWNMLAKLIIVQKQNAPITPILAIEQQAYLRQNIQLLLQQAQWAVLHGQQAVYQNSLRQAQILIQQYFSPNSSVTQAALRNIADLMKINVQPVLPDVSKTIEALK